MPKRRQLIKKIADAAELAGLTWEFEREGGNHSVYELNGVMIPIGRHKDSDNSTARMIYKECESELGKDRWR